MNTYRALAKILIHGVPFRSSRERLYDMKSGGPRTVVNGFAVHGTCLRRTTLGPTLKIVHYTRDSVL